MQLLRVKPWICSNTSTSLRKRVCGNNNSHLGPLEPRLPTSPSIRLPSTSNFPGRHAASRAVVLLFRVWISVFYEVLIAAAHEVGDLHAFCASSLYTAFLTGILYSLRFNLSSTSRAFNLSFISCDRGLIFERKDKLWDGVKLDLTKNVFFAQLRIVNKLDRKSTRLNSSHSQ